MNLNRIYGESLKYGKSGAFSGRVNETNRFCFFAERTATHAAVCPIFRFISRVIKFKSNFPLFTFRMLCINIREDRAGNVMPYAEHGSRDGSERVLGKMCTRQRGGKSGVLHADLDGNGTAFGGVQL